MPLSKNKSLRVIVPIAVVVLILNALIPIYAFKVLNVSYAKTSHSRNTIDKASNVMLTMVDAETGMRGYIITDNTKFLEPYYAARARLENQRHELSELVANTPSAKKLLNTLNKRIDSSLEQIQKTISINESGDNEQATDIVRSSEGKARMDLVRTAVAELIELEKQQLKAQAAYEDKVDTVALTALLFLTLFDVVMFVIAFRLLFNALKTARAAESELNRLHNLSVKYSEQLAASNKIKDTQARLTDQLQAVLTAQEAYTVIERYCTYLFPHNAGTLFIRSHSKDYFQMMAQWGKCNYKDDGFEPMDCWAARSNHIHAYIAQTESMACNHLSHSSPEPHTAVCIPIASSDEMIGIMTLYGQANEDGTINTVDEETINLIQEVVSQIALAISNLRLRENLRNSSIVDVLTGLYNRRYLDETFHREIARSQRSKESIGIIMLDVDHFKNFNDTYGHEAGDHVLHEVGLSLKQACRASDLACRYGGEEFVLLLLNADLKSTIERTAMIREELKKKHLMYGGQSLPAVNVSMGVSMYPHHGSKPEELIRCADEALYKAKHDGRDRVEIAYAHPATDK